MRKAPPSPNQEFLRDGSPPSKTRLLPRHDEGGDRGYSREPEKPDDLLGMFHMKIKPVLANFVSEGPHRFVSLLSHLESVDAPGDARKNPKQESIIMKALFRNIITAAFVVGLATSASAQSPNRGGPFATGVYKQADSQEQIQNLKKGDHYALVCMECNSVTVKEVGDEKQVAALCHDGGAVHCPSCEKKFTVKSVGPRPGGSTVTKVTIVNADGKECIFIAPVKN